MKLKCICGNKFSSNIGIVKCTKCKREYQYTKIRENSELDYDDNVYILNEKSLEKELKDKE